MKIIRWSDHIRLSIGALHVLVHLGFTSIYSYVAIFSQVTQTACILTKRYPNVGVDTRS